METDELIEVILESQASVYRDYFRFLHILSTLNKTLSKDEILALLENELIQGQAEQDPKGFIDELPQPE